MIDERTYGDTRIAISAARASRFGRTMRASRDNRRGRARRAGARRLRRGAGDRPARPACDDRPQRADDPRLHGRAAGVGDAASAGDGDLDLPERGDDDRQPALESWHKLQPASARRALRRADCDDQRACEPGRLRAARRARPAAPAGNARFPSGPARRPAAADSRRCPAPSGSSSSCRRCAAAGPPVAGAALAEELGVSLRTLYRDIAALQAQGAAIEGEAGFGYVLKPGFTLPPLMFTLDEVEALALGARWVEGRADEGLAKSAKDALAKIAAVLPPERAAALDWPTLLAGRGPCGGSGARGAAARPKGARGRAQARLRLRRQGGTPVRARRLAGGDRLLRFGDDARRLVRDARGLPPLPPRPHGPRRGPPRPPAQRPPGPAQGLAAGGGAGGVSASAPLAICESESSLFNALRRLFRFDDAPGGSPRSNPLGSRGYIAEISAAALGASLI